MPSLTPINVCGAGGLGGGRPSGAALGASGAQGLAPPSGQQGTSVEIALQRIQVAQACGLRVEQVTDELLSA